MADPVTPPTANLGQVEAAAETEAKEAVTKPEVVQTKSFLRRAAEQLGKSTLAALTRPESAWGESPSYQITASPLVRYLVPSAFQYFGHGPDVGQADRKGLERISPFTPLQAIAVPFTKIETADTRLNQALTKMQAETVSLVTRSYQAVGEKLGFLYKQIQITDVNITRVNTKLSRLPSQEDYQLLVARIKGLENKKPQEQAHQFRPLEKGEEPIKEDATKADSGLGDFIKNYLKVRGAEWLASALGITAPMLALGLTAVILGTIETYQMNEWRKKYGWSASRPGYFDQWFAGADPNKPLGPGNEGLLPRGAMTDEEFQKAKKQADDYWAAKQVETKKYFDSLDKEAIDAWSSLNKKYTY
jgi:hypothetical protein